MGKLTLAVFLLWSINLKAQVENFGDVPNSDLEMQVYDLDSTANAVVLFSVANSDVTFSFSNVEFEFTLHKRVKILTESGLDEGDIEIFFRNKGSELPQKISDIKAQAYILDDNGELIETKVGRKNRFEEKISDELSVIKFTIPGLKKGSVFEYSYKLRSNNPLDFPSWVFQDEIPVRWSEYKAKSPNDFRFIIVSGGYHDFLINEQSTYEVDYYRYGNKYTYYGTEFHYAMEDIPAIKEEPYMKASMDYLSHIQFQLKSISIPGWGTQSFIGTWAGLVNHLAEDVDLGERLISSVALKEAVDSTLADIEDDLDKMVALFNHVSGTLEWNEEYGLYAFDSLDEIYVKGKGNGASINLILIQMLKEAGFEAFPLILSTRFNGEIFEEVPTPGQFNHTIAYVEIGEVYYLLDAKDDFRPYNMLSLASLNGKGLLIAKDEISWIPLENRTKNSLVDIIDIEITEDGYHGKINSSTKGFYATHYRDVLNLIELNSSVEENVFAQIEGFSVDSAMIINDKRDESFNFIAHFSNKKEWNSSVDYFNPMITGREEENPFKLDVRTFPIDYNHTFSENLILNISLPKGWIVDEIPESVLKRLPENTGEFRRIAQTTGNAITINYRFKINKERFMPEEYSVLKEFYNQMVTSLTENIVLKRGGE